MPASASDSLFDRSREYEAELNRGLRMSGEDRDFYLDARVRYLVGRLAGLPPPRRILDFGCGFGDTSERLARAFPGSEVLGIDTALQALDHARSHFGSARVRFEPIADFRATDCFDLCYANGVFHHVPPAERRVAVERVRRALVAGGRFALFENNPWNPGTRLLMHRLEFDRDAIPISPRQAHVMLREGGFRECAPTRFLFFFPRPLAFLRSLEPKLERFPLGAQYLVLATRGGSGEPVC